MFWARALDASYETSGATADMLGVVKGRMGLPVIDATPIFVASLSRAGAPAVVCDRRI